MGCDIHMCFEQKIDGKWVNVDIKTPNQYFNQDENDYEPEYHIEEVCGRRNYWLFAILANVRNYEEKFMSYPKGIPDDADPFTAEEHRRMDSDAHSASHHTLYDIVEFNKENNDAHGAVMIEEEDNEYEELNRIERYRLIPDVYPLEYLIEKINERIESMGDYDVKDEEVQQSFRIVFWFDN